jgi:hypothetical protein
LAYEEDSQGIERNAVDNAVAGMKTALLPSKKERRSRILGLAGEISGLYEVVIKRGSTLEKISLGRLKAVSEKVHGRTGVVKEFDAVSSNTVFEFKFHLSLRKLYQQVIGIGSAVGMPHLKALTKYSKFGGIRNLVYFGEADSGYVVKAIREFIERNPGVIPRVDISQRGVSVKFSLPEMLAFLCHNSTIALLRKENRGQRGYFLPRDLRQQRESIAELINSKIQKLQGQRFDVIIAVNNASEEDLTALKGSLRGGSSESTKLSPITSSEGVPLERFVKRDRDSRNGGDEGSGTSEAGLPTLPKVTPVTDELELAAEGANVSEAVEGCI